MSSLALASSLSLALAIVPTGAKFGEKFERVLIADAGRKPFGNLLAHPGDLFRRLGPRSLSHVAADKLDDIVGFVGVAFSQPPGDPLLDLGREVHLAHGFSICPLRCGSKQHCLRFLATRRATSVAARRPRPRAG